MCLIFHDWGQWKVYKLEYNFILCGKHIPTELQGTEILRTETRQKRKCKECGKTQDEKVR